jgi:hypothetical protein
MGLKHDGVISGAASKSNAGDGGVDSTRPREEGGRGRVGQRARLILPPIKQGRQYAPGNNDPN